jgi:hypothetical protein
MGGPPIKKAYQVESETWGLPLDIREKEKFSG